MFKARSGRWVGIEAGKERWCKREPRGKTEGTACWSNERGQFSLSGAQTVREEVVRGQPGRQKPDYAETWNLCRKSELCPRSNRKPLKILCKRGEKLRCILVRNHSGCTAMVEGMIGKDKARSWETLGEQSWWEMTIGGEKTFYLQAHLLVPSTPTVTLSHLVFIFPGCLKKKKGSLRVVSKEQQQNRILGSHTYRQCALCRSVMSDSLQSHGLKPTRLLCL